MARRQQMFTRLKPASIERLDALVEQRGYDRSKVVRELLMKADAEIRRIEKSDG
jgi:hypothetical protein